MSQSLIVPDSAEKRIQKLYDDPMFADFTIRSKGGREFKVHKVIIAGCLPVAATLKHGFQESRESVMVMDESDHAIEEFVKHLYGFIFKVPPNERDTATLYQAVDVYAIAKMRMLPRLKREAHAGICAHLQHMDWDKSKDGMDVEAFCHLIDSIFAVDLREDVEIRALLIASLKKYRGASAGTEAGDKMLHIVKQCPMFALDLVKQGVTAATCFNELIAEERSLEVSCTGSNCGKDVERRICITTTRGKHFCIDCIRKQSLPRDWFVKPEAK